MADRYSEYCLFISIGLLITSLTQDAYCTSNLCRSSIDAFLTGSIGFLFGGAALTWLANPFLIISWILAGKKKYAISLIPSLLAVAISISFLFLHDIVDNEAGHINLIVKYNSGYWLWVMSCLVMVTGNFLYVLKRSF